MLRFRNRPTRRRIPPPTPHRIAPAEAPDVFRRNGLTPVVGAFLGDGCGCLLAATAIDRGMDPGAIRELDDEVTLGDGDPAAAFGAVVGVLAARIGVARAYADGIYLGWDNPADAIERLLRTEPAGDFADGLRDGCAARVACSNAGLFPAIMEAEPAEAVAV